VEDGKFDELETWLEENHYSSLDRKRFCEFANYEWDRLDSLIFVEMDEDGHIVKRTIGDLGQYRPQFEAFVMFLETLVSRSGKGEMPLMFGIPQDESGVPSLFIDIHKHIPGISWEELVGLCRSKLEYIRLIIDYKNKRVVVEPKSADSADDFSTEGDGFGEFERDCLIKAMHAEGGKFLEISAMDPEERTCEVVIFEDGKKSDRSMTPEEKRIRATPYLKAKERIERYSKGRIRVPKKIYVILRLPKQVNKCNLSISREGVFVVNGASAGATWYDDALLISGVTTKDMARLHTRIAHESAVLGCIHENEASGERRHNKFEQHMQGLMAEEEVLRGLHGKGRINNRVLHLYQRRINEDMRLTEAARKEAVAKDAKVVLVLKQDDYAAEKTSIFKEKTISQRAQEALACIETIEKYLRQLEPFLGKVVNYQVRQCLEKVENYLLAGRRLSTERLEQLYIDFFEAVEKLNAGLAKLSHGTKDQKRFLGWLEYSFRQLHDCLGRIAKLIPGGEKIAGKGPDFITLTIGHIQDNEASPQRRISRQSAIADRRIIFLLPFVAILSILFRGPLAFLFSHTWSLISEFPICLAVLASIFFVCVRVINIKFLPRRIERKFSITPYQAKFVRNVGFSLFSLLYVVAGIGICVSAFYWALPWLYAHPQVTASLFPLAGVGMCMVGEDGRQGSPDVRREQGIVAKPMLGALAITAVVVFFVWPLLSSLAKNYPGLELFYWIGIAGVMIAFGNYVYTRFAYRMRCKVLPSNKDTSVQESNPDSNGNNAVLSPSVTVEPSALQLPPVTLQIQEEYSFPGVSIEQKQYDVPVYQGQLLSWHVIAVRINNQQYFIGDKYYLVITLANGKKIYWGGIHNLAHAFFAEHYKHRARKIIEAGGLVWFALDGHDDFGEYEYRNWQLQPKKDFQWEQEVAYGVSSLSPGNYLGYVATTGVISHLKCARALSYPQGELHIENIGIPSEECGVVELAAQGIEGGVFDLGIDIVVEDNPNLSTAETMTNFQAMRPHFVTLAEHSDVCFLIDSSEYNKVSKRCCFIDPVLANKCNALLIQDLAERALSASPAMLREASAKHDELQRQAQDLGDTTGWMPDRCGSIHEALFAETSQPEARFILKNLSLNGNESICDIGSGKGDFCLACRESFPRARITGLEIDPVKVKVSKERLRRSKLREIVFLANHALDPEINYGEFDIIYMNLPLTFSRKFYSALAERLVAHMHIGARLVLRMDAQPQELDQRHAKDILRKALREQYSNLLTYSYFVIPPEIAPCVPGKSNLVEVYARNKNNRTVSTGAIAAPGVAQEVSPKGEVAQDANDTVQGLKITWAGTENRGKNALRVACVQLKAGMFVENTGRITTITQRLSDRVRQPAVDIVFFPEDLDKDGVATQEMLASRRDVLQSIADKTGIAIGYSLNCPGGKILYRLIHPHLPAHIFFKNAWQRERRVVPVKNHRIVLFICLEALKVFSLVRTRIMGPVILAPPAKELAARIMSAIEEADAIIVPCDTSGRFADSCALALKRLFEKPTVFINLSKPRGGRSLFYTAASEQKPIVLGETDEEILVIDICAAVTGLSDEHGRFVSVEAETNGRVVITKPPAPAMLPGPERERVEFLAQRWLWYSCGAALGLMAGAAALAVFGWKAACAVALISFLVGRRIPWMMAKPIIMRKAREEEEQRHRLYQEQRRRGEGQDVDAPKARSHLFALQHLYPPESPEYISVYNFALRTDPLKMEYIDDTYRKHYAHNKDWFFKHEAGLAMADYHEEHCRRCSQLSGLQNAMKQTFPTQMRIMFSRSKDLFYYLLQASRLSRASALIMAGLQILAGSHNYASAQVPFNTLWQTNISIIEERIKSKTILPDQKIISFSFEGKKYTTGVIIRFYRDDGIEVIVVKENYPKEFPFYAFADPAGRKIYLNPMAISDFMLLVIWPAMTGSAPDIWQDKAAEKALSPEQRGEIRNLMGDFIRRSLQGQGRDGLINSLVVMLMDHEAGHIKGIIGTDGVTWESFIDYFSKVRLPQQTNDSVNLERLFAVHGQALVYLFSETTMRLQELANSDEPALAFIRTVCNLDSFDPTDRHFITMSLLIKEMTGADFTRDINLAHRSLCNYLKQLSQMNRRQIEQKLRHDARAVQVRLHLDRPEYIDATLKQEAAADKRGRYWIYLGVVCAGMGLFLGGKLLRNRRRENGKAKPSSPSGNRAFTRRWSRGHRGFRGESHPIPKIQSRNIKISILIAIVVLLGLGLGVLVSLVWPELWSSLFLSGLPLVNATVQPVSEEGSSAPLQI
ncbi:MAG: methyltransferase domain-containing protein, partial [Candidatus Omnitrophica bacterium]|nr:methyltransferase domain-containing protein [Candidatus Omnitrophota bacterium]